MYETPQDQFLSPSAPWAIASVAQSTAGSNRRQSGAGKEQSAYRQQDHARTKSQAQQSLHRRHRRHRWFSHASFVHAMQISRDGSPQMLHANTYSTTGEPTPGFASGRGGRGAPEPPWSAFHDNVVPPHS